MVKSPRTRAYLSHIFTYYAHIYDVYAHTHTHIHTHTQSMGVGPGPSYECVRFSVLGRSPLLQHFLLSHHLSEEVAEESFSRSTVSRTQVKELPYPKPLCLCVCEWERKRERGGDQTRPSHKLIFLQHVRGLTNHYNGTMRSDACWCPCLVGVVPWQDVGRGPSVSYGELLEQRATAAKEKYDTYERWPLKT